MFTGGMIWILTHGLMGTRTALAWNPLTFWGIPGKGLVEVVGAPVMESVAALGRLRARWNVDAARDIFKDLFVRVSDSRITTMRFVGKEEARSGKAWQNLKVISGEWIKAGICNFILGAMALSVTAFDSQRLCVNETQRLLGSVRQLHMQQRQGTHMPSAKKVHVFVLNSLAFCRSCVFPNDL